jgi:hypothetical protein
MTGQGAMDDHIAPLRIYYIQFQEPHPAARAVGLGVGRPVVTVLFRKPE